MFKKALKNKIVPITIVALALAVGLALIFNVSSIYKKKSIINTYQKKEAEKTFTGDGSGCNSRFELLHPNVVPNDDTDDDGYFTYTITTQSTKTEYNKLIKESGYNANDGISYKYVVKKQKSDKSWENIDSGVVNVSKTGYTSSKNSKKISTKGTYKVILYSRAWIRDKKCTLGEGNYTTNSSPDEGYCTCDSGKQYYVYQFKPESMSLEKNILKQDTFTIEGDWETESETDLTPSGQGKNDNVDYDNYNVDAACKLPENSQANKYLLTDTSVYPGEKSNSATFNKYLTEFNNAPASKKASAELNSNDEVKNLSMALNLTCDYKLDINDIKDVANNDLIAYDSKGMRYYKYDSSNTHYFKASKTEKFTVEDYKLHTATGKTIDNKDNYCTRTCTEIVKVEYGAPVYVEGGMCFQYRMKVNSIVQCEYDKSHMKKPSKSYKLCQPTAYCVHGSYTSYGKSSNTQAGPNEDYEACVNECDGGKYTPDCSNACYNIVYNNQNKENLKLINIKPTNTGTRVGDQFTYFEYNHGVKFTSGWTGNQSVGQTLGNDGKKDVTGTSMKGYVVKHLSSRTTSYRIIDGIPRADYGNDYCHESCGWVKGKQDACKLSPSEWYFDGDTMNPNFGKNVAKADFKANLEKYNDTLKECKAKATCISSTATYTIKVKYVDASGENLKVTEAVYPTSPSKKTETKSPSTSCALSMGNLNPVISFGGCYVNSNADRWYQGEMTFPGAYFDYKHNTIIVKSKNADNEIIYPGRMCIPKAQGNTNAVWAKKFDMAIGQYNKNHSYTISNLDNYWKDTFSGAAYNSDSDDANGYNIYGEIRNFGFFKWDFNISCFYSLYDQSTCDTDEIACYNNCKDKPVCVKANNAKANGVCKKTCSPDDTYTIRSFNASDPLVTSNNRESEDIQTRDTNDIRGFNWTSSATLSKMHNGYDNDPEKLIEHIIENQNTVFNDNENEPNYVIYLDTATLKEIKKYNKTNSYTTFNDSNPSDISRINEAGVKFYYSSSFLHNSAIFSSKLNSIPTLNSSLYKCNLFENNECVMLGGGE